MVWNYVANKYGVPECDDSSQQLIRSGLDLDPPKVDCGVNRTNRDPIRIRVLV